ncbi:Stealth CR1 domain-containing protein [Vibrio breoganii]
MNKIKRQIKRLIGQRGTKTYNYVRYLYHFIINKFESDKLANEIITNADEAYNNTRREVYELIGSTATLRYDNSESKECFVITDIDLLTDIIYRLEKQGFQFAIKSKSNIKCKSVIKTIKKNNLLSFIVYKDYRASYNSKMCSFSKECGVILTLPSDKYDSLKSNKSPYDFPVDVVYTWVNGEDPEWLEKKNLYLDSSINRLNTATSDSRFRSRNELLYSIRSIEMFAPWVRNIYIITDSQTPTWFKETDRIKVVDHQQIFPDKTVLPVFNSHAIESCLHRIKGLSQHFLYFNDDVVLGRKTEKKDFFSPFGYSSYFFYSNQTFIPKNIDENTLPVDVAAYNNAKLIFELFGYNTNRKFKHTPIPLLKDKLAYIEKTIPEIFETNRNEKFRSARDYSIVSAFYHHFGLIHGFTQSKNIKYDYINLGDRSYKLKLKSLSCMKMGSRPVCYCINDVDSDDLDQEEISRDFLACVTEIYPVSSSCEKTNN